MPSDRSPDPGNVVLTGYIDAPEDRLAAIRAALPGHIALTRAEPGCIWFNVDPCPRVAGRFLVSECFTDQAAFNDHQVRTKASPWAAIARDIPRSYKVKTQS